LGRFRSLATDGNRPNLEVRWPLARGRRRASRCPPPDGRMSARANRAAHGLASTSSAPPSLRFAEVEGFQIVAEHVEIETGKGSDALERRPQLAAALAEARRNGRACPVAVSKLERLSRDVHFISGLTAHRTPFLVADLGSDVERCEISFAEPHEGGGYRFISEPTRRHGRLGCYWGGT
jgi:hypothetical protein